MIRALDRANTRYNINSEQNTTVYACREGGRDHAAGCPATVVNSCSRTHTTVNTTAENKDKTHSLHTRIQQHKKEKEKHLQQRVSTARTPRNAATQEQNTDRYVRFWLRFTTPATYCTTGGRPKIFKEKGRSQTGTTGDYVRLGKPRYTLPTSTVVMTKKSVIL